MRPVYGAVFFTDSGVLWAIDSDGNVYSLDLKASTKGAPIKASDILTYETVGGGKIKLTPMRVLDAAGRVADPIVKPLYTHHLPVSATLAMTSDTSWLPPSRMVKGFTYTWDIHVTGQDLDTKDPLPVRRFRIWFQPPEGGEIVQAGGFDIHTQASGSTTMIYLEPPPDHFIPPGQPLAVDCLICVSGADQKPTGLKGLGAAQLD